MSLPHDFAELRRIVRLEWIQQVSMGGENILNDHCNVPRRIWPDNGPKVSHHVHDSDSGARRWWRW
jgi:hypothetical protein